MRGLIDPPLTTKECAVWMGFTTNWIRAAITKGVTVGATTVKLEAETVIVNGRCAHRIYLDQFCVFLAAIGWKRLPRQARAVSPLESSDEAGVH